MPAAVAANALVKAKMVEFDAAWTYRRAGERVRREGIPVPVGDELKAALAQRLGDRPAQRGWPKKMGELHIFLAYGISNWEAVLPKALSPFGRVSTFEWGSQGFDQRSPDWADERKVMNKAMLDAFERASEQAPVDVVVGYVSGRTVEPDVLAKMAARGAVIVNFCFDDKIAFPGDVVGDLHASTASIAHSVDLNLTSDPRPPAKYAIYGGLAMFHPEAADPEESHPVEAPFQYDVSFIGAKYGFRPKLMRRLQKLGVKVACFGRGWPNGSVAMSDMNRIYSVSRINLGFGGIGYSDRLLCLKGRDFEVPMSGGLYLTQHNPELGLVYELGEEILTYRTAEDCAQTIQAILEDPDRAARIRAAGRARALKDHTYLARWTRVFETLGALSSSPQPQRG